MMSDYVTLAGKKWLSFFKNSLLGMFRKYASTSKDDYVPGSFDHFADDPGLLP